MKRIVILFYFFVLCRGTIAQERPNIVLIMVDDMGFSDIGCYGGEIETPNLDRLAAKGIRFTQFYNTSRCCPSRASLLTGLDHHQAGMGLMIEDRTNKPGYLGYLARERSTTIAELLQAENYGTYMCGKWHLGYQNMDERPLAWGFDHFYGSLEGAISCFEPGNPAKYPHDKRPRPVTLDNDTITPDKNYYSTNRFTEYGMLFLEQHFNERDDDPFFLYMAYNAPHWPLHALSQDIKKYEDYYLKGWDRLREERYQRQLELGILKAENTQLSPRTDDRYAPGGLWPFTRNPLPAWDSLAEGQQRDLAKKMAVYAAMIDNVDQNIGRLINFLSEKNELDNTIIVFLSDNGGAIGGNLMGFNALGERGKLGLYGTKDSFMSYGTGWANASNTPFRMYKCYVHEGGISSPLIVHWPDKIKEQKQVEIPTHITDIMPTLLELSGVAYPERIDNRNLIELPGQSLLPLLTSHTGSFNENRQLCWEHAGSKAIRNGKWKLVQVHGESWELYNMHEDRCESNDLMDKYPEQAQRMKEMYDVWADKAYVNPPLHE